MNYYPHIDGLRAVAILFVLFFHGGFKLFPSGFIGVDIFFVISGFLITGIIVDSLDKQKFFFAQFYSRRLWRLQPVFICLLLITALFSLALYLPDDLIFYSKSLRKTALYLSNNFFSGATTGYFAPDGKEYALMHTWSLSIEWQCYFILPILIYLGHRFFQKNLNKMICLLTFVSMAVAFYSFYFEVSTAYYKLSSRMFEFLIGSCIALNNKNWILPRQVFSLIGIAAFATLIYIAMKSDVAVDFPNGYAFLVCCATGLLIKLGTYQQSYITRILSTKIMVFIGLISYSLYIWHWPILAFSHYMEFSDTIWVTILTFAVIFITSYCSWLFIEKPARHGVSMKPVYTILLLFLLPTIALQAMVYIIIKHDGFPSRFVTLDTVVTNLKKHHSEQRNACLVFHNTNVSDKCTFGSSNPKAKTGFMIGDSFSNHYWRFMEYFAKRANISIIAQATGSCLALPNIAQYDHIKRTTIYKVCQHQTKLYYEMIKSNHYDYVILGESWNGYLGTIVIDKVQQVSAQEQIERALDNTLDLIIKAGSRPIILKAIALSTKGDPYRCFMRHFKHKKDYDPSECDYDIPANHQTWINSVFAKMKIKYPQLILIDPQKLLCNKNHCKVVINNIPVFRDAAHLTDYASYQLAKRYLKRYNNPLLS